MLAGYVSTWGAGLVSHVQCFREPALAPLRGLVAIVGGRGWASSSPQPIKPEVFPETRCSLLGSVLGLMTRRKPGCRSAGIWLVASPGMAENRLEAVGGSDPIYPAGPLEGSGHRLVRLAHGTGCRVEFSPSALGFGSVLA